MFEVLSVYRTTDNAETAPNAFWPVEEQAIVRAEGRMGLKFPEQLRMLLFEAGTGTIKAKKGEESHFKYSNFVNRFLGPTEMAELFLGEPIDSAPEEGFDDGELPFFEVGDQEYFVLRPRTEEPNAVYRAFGEAVADDVLSFVGKLLEEPYFYLDI